MSKRKVAIFDVDGTIFRSSLLIELTESLIEAGLFPADTPRSYQKSLSKWLSRRGSYEDYIADVIKIFEKNLKGVAYSEFAKVTEKVAAFHGNRVYRHTRDLVKKLKKKGYFLLAISNSPKTILDKFCQKLGFNKVYGRFYELGPEDRFTGQIIDLHLIANKANVVKRAVEKEKLTLVGSIGVGDTESDISFLELVARPIAFNPNQKLYRYAKLNGWEIVVERKDVIYRL